MAKSKSTSVPDNSFEHTGSEIRCLVKALRPCDDIDNLSEAYRQGRAVVLELAESCANYEGPTRRMSLEECAAVLDYLSLSSPRYPATFSTERPNKPCAWMGLDHVLYAIAEELREPRRARLEVVNG